MSRRKSDADQEFGSDSFLDIIANIVGILIILIVVAGVKVARQAEARDPIAVQLSQNLDGVPQPMADDALLDQPSKPTVWPWANDQTVDVEDGPTSKISAAEIEVARNRLLELQDLESEYDKQVQELTLQSEEAIKELEASKERIAELQESLSESQQRDQHAVMQFASVQRELQMTKSTVESLEEELKEETKRGVLYQGTLDSLDQRQKYVHDALQQIGMETRQLNEVLKQNQENTPESDLLKHRLSPVGQQVAEDEIHFRLSAGRIAHVPLDALLKRLKEQMVTRQNLVAKFHRYNGSVGPVQGFRMEYIVQRQSLPPLQAMQYGQAPYQLSVSRWQIHPAETLEAETVVEALRIGSRFRQILERTYPETAITIWLYPNDFQHFHRLRQFAHQLDLRVAARPLPDGFPITASPSGSRSTSQ